MDLKKFLTKLVRVIFLRLRVYMYDTMPGTCTCTCRQAWRQLSVHSPKTWHWQSAVCYKLDARQKAMEEQCLWSLSSWVYIIKHTSSTMVGDWATNVRVRHKQDYYHRGERGSFTVMYSNISSNSNAIKFEELHYDLSAPDSDCASLWRQRHCQQF